ncbi:MAG: PaaI family thioesterase [Burkholderiales bacterium]|nr:PaaI family thioesterase [Burkholderiales bacterium]
MSKPSTAPGTRNMLPHGVTPLEEVKHLSGLEFMQGILEGRFPRAPITAALKFDLVEVEQGRAIFEGVPEFAFYNPISSVHGGYAATLLDSCMGCAVHTTLPAGQAYTTLEFKINFVRAMTEKTGRVRAEGRVIHPGNRAATAEGNLYDAGGKLLAHATTTCMIFPI